MNASFPGQPKRAERFLVAGFFAAEGLPWLLRLRWLAVVGQFSTCLVVDRLFGYDLPWRVLWPFLFVTASTNLVAMRFPRTLPSDPHHACAVLLLQDTLVLSGMLWWTGGVRNPFAGFYLLHVVIAAVVLPRGWAWGMLAVSSLCLAGQFLSPFRLAPARPGSWLPDDPSRAGLLVALVLAGASVAYFVGRLRATLERRDAELARTRDRSERHERFASVATLAAGVAHELATPLSTIAVVSADFEKLAAGSCAKAECIADARLIRSEVERCRGILENLGNQATSGIGDPVGAVDIRGIPERLGPYLAPANLARLVFEGFSNAGQVVVPEPALLQSLAALAKNACEASPDGAKVRVSVRSTARDVVFQVEDGGHGMPAEVVARAGEPFYTTKGPGKGMGLGLFLVRTFVERVQGSLEIDSRPGEGTVFRLAIPREGAAP
jgi:two-component system, sensor histidine kinase RegB